IGNSLVVAGNEYFHTQLDAVLSNCTLTFLGTQGTTTKHEGYGGYSYESFVSASSPFFKAGVIDVQSYFTDNLIDTPDVIFMRLGVNTCYGCSNTSLSNASRLASLNSEVGYAKQLISAFLALNANMKIIVGLSTLCENTGAGWKSNYDESVMSQDLYIEWSHRFWDLLVTNFDNGLYDSRVLMSNEAIFLDRNDGYQKTAGVHNSGVHPDRSGYEQLGVGMALALNKLLTTN
ncbi:MAG: hypothetical protein IQL11_14870, partial [Bacteroidales bacterium]|nr:hypothetical protein [Bacteroidales bacterium]